MSFPFPGRLFLRVCMEKLARFFFIPYHNNHLNLAFSAAFQLTTLSIIGFLIQLTTNEAKYKYLGTFFGAAGIYPNVSQTVAWNGNNIGGSTKRSVGIAMQVGFGNLGGVLSCFTYTYKDVPKYHRGHAIVIGLLTMSTILCIFMRWWCDRENKRRDEADAQSGRGNGWSKSDMMRESGKGDHAGFFRYTL